MKNIQITARFKIHEGKLDAFKKLANECINTVKEKEKDTLQYDWFFNKDQTECVVREKYKDSDAFMVHMGNIGALLGQIIAISDFSPEIYGNPSATMLEAAAPFQPEIYSYYQGISSE